MTSKSVIDAICVHKDRIDTMSYGQITFTIQAGKVHRIECSESYLVEQNKPSRPE